MVYSRFTKEEVELERLHNLLNLTQLLRDNDTTQTQSYLIAAFDLLFTLFHGPPSIPLQEGLCHPLLAQERPLI